jgi:hypothetical protein
MYTTSKQTTMECDLSISICFILLLLGTCSQMLRVKNKAT